MKGSIHTPNIQITSYEEYARLEGRWEVYDGKPKAMASPSFEHQIVLSQVNVLFSNELAKCTDCAAIQSPFDWQVKKDTILQPDLLVLCKPNTEAPYTGLPALLMEALSPSTAMHDMNKKFKIYEKAGVPYYLIADPVNKFLTIYVLNGGVYQQYFIPPEESKFIYTFDFGQCKATIDFSNIFPIIDTESL